VEGLISLLICQKRIVLDDMSMVELNKMSMSELLALWEEVQAMIDEIEMDSTEISEYLLNDILESGVGRPTSLD